MVVVGEEDGEGEGEDHDQGLAVWCCDAMVMRMSPFLRLAQPKVRYGCSQACAGANVQLSNDISSSCDRAFSISCPFVLAPNSSSLPSSSTRFPASTVFSQSSRAFIFRRFSFQCTFTLCLRFQSLYISHHTFDCIRRCNVWRWHTSMRLTR